MAQHFAIQALGSKLINGLCGTVEKLDSPDPALFQLPGDPSAACTTLRPFDQWDLSFWPGHEREARLSRGLSAAGSEQREALAECIAKGAHLQA